MFDFTAVEIDRVVVKARVFDESDPFSPTRWDVRPVVFVQVFAKISRAITDVGEIRCERSSLVRFAPMRPRAIIVVRVHVVIVHVEA